MPRPCTVFGLRACLFVLWRVVACCGEARRSRSRNRLFAHCRHKAHCGFGSRAHITYPFRNFVLAVFCFFAA